MDQVMDVSYQEAGVPQLADDSLIRIAREAEARIDAVNKIKQIALKVTNARDWTDQGGNPYLQVSGSEKVAGVFNVSWRIGEPLYEEDSDGHFTYTYQGRFSIPGREIEVTGSRSSKDPFFKKYDYIKEAGKPDRKVEKPISAIDKRDVKMAAMTNLLGNGITRLLGIRNLTWQDLETYAGIKKEDIGKVEYKGKDGSKPPINPPGKKTDKAPDDAPLQNVTIKVHDVTTKEGKTGEKEWRLFSIVSTDGVTYKTFSDTYKAMADESVPDGKALAITFKTEKNGNLIVGMDWAA